MGVRPPSWWHHGGVRTQRTAPWLGAVVALLLGAAVLLVPGSAAAATKTVTLSNQGPDATSITIAKGDAVKFVNSDSTTHTVARATGSWTFNQPIPAGKSATTSAFSAAGTYTYTDKFTFVALPRSVTGTITVTATAPSPTASPKPKPTPTKSTAPKPTGTATTPAASAAPSATSGTGTAVGPGIGVGSIPTATPTTSGVPRPDIAGPGATATITAAPGVLYSGRGLVQSSPHRYGLPAALAVVGITGVASLLVRFLLAQPAARRRRAGPAGPVVTVEQG